MTMALSQDDMVSIAGRIDLLQKSARRTLPMFLIGILATLVAAAVAIYYIVTLSGDLRAAQQALRTSQRRVALAQQNLSIANEALRKAQAESPSGANAEQITAAISDVTRSQRQLSYASASVREAASKLPASLPADDASVVAAPQWFAVVGSYRLDATGLANASAQAGRAQAAGLCAEMWQTRISRNYAVVIGTISDRPTALANMARARSTGLADDAFVQPNRDWTKLPQSPQC